MRLLPSISALEPDLDAANRANPGESARARAGGPYAALSFVDPPAVPAVARRAWAPPPFARLKLGHPIPRRAAT
jgi:hypothetical protein